MAAERNGRKTLALGGEGWSPNPNRADQKCHGPEEAMVTRQKCLFPLRTPSGRGVTFLSHSSAWTPPPNPRLLDGDGRAIDHHRRVNFAVVGHHGSGRRRLRNLDLRLPADVSRVEGDAAHRTW